jgi:hypothetical protein
MKSPHGEGEVAAVAREMKLAYEAVSPFIEKHTARACPSCPKVCCIDRHAVHEEEDTAFFSALGIDPPHMRAKERDTEPCRHISSRGCSLPRWQRPYRCTWYFCQALLDEMPEENAGEYRKFIGALRRLRLLRQRLLGSGGDVPHLPQSDSLPARPGQAEKRVAIPPGRKG